MGEFETVMQTRDEVEGLHNRREFSQRLEFLYQAMQTQEKSFLLLLYNNFPEKKTQNSLYGTDQKRNSYQSQNLVHEVLKA